MINFKSIKGILFALFFIVLGFFIGVASLTPFDFSKTISIIINPSIIITIMLAFYVTRVLTRQNEKDKQEKLVLIEYFKDFKKQLHAKSEEIVNANFNSTCNMHFKFLRQKLYSSLELAKQQNFLINHQDKEDLSNTMTDIWEILTDESHYENKGMKLSHRSLLNTRIIKIDELIFKIIIKINNI